MKDKRNGAAHSLNNNSADLAGADPGGAGHPAGAGLAGANGLQHKGPGLNGAGGMPPRSEQGVYRRKAGHNDVIRADDDVIGGVSEVEPEEAEPGDVIDVPTRMQVLKDPANLCTFCGALLAMLAMASMWRGR